MCPGISVLFSLCSILLVFLQCLFLILFLSLCFDVLVRQVTQTSTVTMQSLPLFFLSFFLSCFPLLLFL
ncbi:hypothetical protein BDF14DRAFT_1753520 [Spinellus fusiger]|nr:hypothetical protein BDF14DRAFT_1753520 [Spinellus fusiger]